MTASAQTAVAEACALVRAPEADMEQRAWQRLDALAKPARSLGRLEDTAVRMAVAQGTLAPSCAPASVALFAADHGVAAEGVSAWPSDVTRQMVSTFAAGGGAINQIAQHVGARLELIDVGVGSDTSMFEGVIQAKIRPGTANMALEPAMTREEAACAVMVGVEVAGRLAARGVKVVATGEMGIGNTTAAAALAAVYTGMPAERVVGRGTGIDDEAFGRKTHVVKRALALHRPDAEDALGVLASVGGLEIAAMAGLLIGGAQERMCVVLDGFISGAAALAAVGLCPEALAYVFPSHLSDEPGHALVLEALGLKPLLPLEMRLGEGTGAALALPLMGAACSVMKGMATLEEAGVCNDALDQG